MLKSMRKFLPPLLTDKYSTFTRLDESRVFDKFSGLRSDMIQHTPHHCTASCCINIPSRLFNCRSEACLLETRPWPHGQTSFWIVFFWFLWTSFRRQYEIWWCIEVHVLGLACLLIPCSRVLLEKLTSSQLVKKFPEADSEFQLWPMHQ